MKRFRARRAKNAAPGGEIVVALAGNPNVGKSTLFNLLTGLKQHTGNWPGKTVGSAWGRCVVDGQRFLLADTPGAYSLIARSAEEAAARDAISFGGADVAAIVCDATCLERGLNLALQVIEACPRAVVCLNLMDEARRQGIRIDLAALARMLGVRVTACTARSGEGVRELLCAVRAAAREPAAPPPVRYAPALEKACETIAAALDGSAGPSARFTALRLLEADAETTARLEAALGMRVCELPLPAALRARLAIAKGDAAGAGRLPAFTGAAIRGERPLLRETPPARTSSAAASRARQGSSDVPAGAVGPARRPCGPAALFAAAGRADGLSQRHPCAAPFAASNTGEPFAADKSEDGKLPDAPGCVDALFPGLPSPDGVREEIVSAVYRRAEAIVAACVRRGPDARARQTRIDRLLTGRLTALPGMLLLLALVLYLTVEGANVPSAFLSTLFARMESALSSALRAAKAAPWLVSALCEGVLRVLGWVVAVMLPPMAIFFPLFTLLEDLGYLPRVAFNLDRCFKRCRACGKQALTMCMGLGCNAVGVVGCRIIDSPRERLIAILTNAFMPCNGRFPLLIALVSLFLAPSGPMAALMLAGLIVLAVCITLAACRALSATLLRGMPSAFTLELPPLRRPQVGRVIVRSILDRTLHVLSRAVVVAAPAGLVIWALANIEAHGASLLTHGVRFLDPFARVLGLDGAILMAFVLAFPANEIVLPLAMMAYLSAGTLAQPESAQALGALFRAQGWTWLTALNTILFSMMHWPCSTTVLTIARETRSVKWTLTAVLLPTACGMTICALTTLAARALRLA